MHELALMREIVQMVQARLQTEPGARVAVVRLRVGALSHVGQERPGDLQLLFSMAAAGTPLADARLEIARVPADALCASCGERCAVEEWPSRCPACGALALVPAAGPEVVLQEVVVR
jgi:hydrogenase nickel incorporation protein HypA/HybF